MRMNNNHQDSHTIRQTSAAMSATTRPSHEASAPTRSAGTASLRKPTNLSLAAGLVAEARALGINVSQAAEVGIAAAVARRRQERWLAENQAALDSSNAFVEQQGVPLARYRMF
jgi:antitoxin CcdA